MIGSLYTGLSGIKSHQKQLEVIGNNISNVNTTGYKTARILFSDTLSQSIDSARFGTEGMGGKDPKQIGTGVQLGTIDNLFKQGALQETGVSTDLSLDGRGFFVVSNGENKFYTRAGAFDVDEQGYFIDSGTGMVAQGRAANTQGEIETGTPIADLQLNFGGKIPAKETSKISLACNLDARGDTDLLVADTSFTETVTRSERSFTTNIGAAATEITELNDLDQTTDDLSSGDTITISDGINPDVTFTYGAANDGTTLKDFLTIVETHTAITGTADINANGNLVIEPPVSNVVISFSNSNPNDDESRIALPKLDTATMPVDENTDIAGSRPAPLISDSTFTTGGGTGVATATTALTSAALDQITTDLSAGPPADTITISDGISTATYTYAAGNTLQDLLTAIEGLSSVRSAIIDSNGKMVIDSGSDITFSPGAGNTGAITLPTSYSRAGSRISDIAFTTGGGTGVASASTVLTSAALDQVTTDFTVGPPADTITVSDGANTATYTYAAGNTLQDLLTVIEGLSSVNSAAIDSKGRLVVDSASDITFSSSSGNTGVMTLPDSISTTIDISPQDGDTITISGKDSDGNDVNASFTYGTANDGITWRDLLDEIDEAYIRSSVSLDDNGNIVVHPPDDADSRVDLVLTSSSGLTLPNFNFEGYKYDTTFVAYDSEGYEHTMTMIFEKLSEFPDENSENKWSWKITMSGVEVQEGTNTGDVTFNSDGSLKNFSFADPEATALQFDPSNGAGLVSINLNVGTESEFDGLTQFASESSVVARHQDGYSMGMLQDFAVDEWGNITGIFGNGITRNLAQLSVAYFINPGGLLKRGNGYYQPSGNSGQAILGQAGTSGLGNIRSRYLENSNVDLANEFTKLIMAQRGFQANSNVITTTDTVFADLMRLKRA